MKKPKNSKVISFTKWRKMKEFFGATKTRGAIRQSSDGNLWEIEESLMGKVMVKRITIAELPSEFV